MRWSPGEYDAWLARQHERAIANEMKQPEIMEKDLHSRIHEDCTRRGWVAFHGVMSKRTHRTLGEPDFVILAAGGRLIMVEVKSRTGKLSPAQHAMGFHAEHLGHKIHVVRGFDEWIKIADYTEET